MIAEDTIRFLSSMRYDEKAELKHCIIPLRGVCWADEMQSFGSLPKLDHTARGQVFRLFQIRYAMWEGREVTPEDMKLFEMASLAVPECPIFKRLTPKENYLEAQRRINNEYEFMVDTMNQRLGQPEMRRNSDGSTTTSWNLE